ncbi:hypothetical protein [Actinomycetospora sp.]|uniref:hypothetical protein n=1 Tax=Actinomycetospora sp. TaxID=1872135 RepID=UPI0039C88990
MARRNRRAAGGGPRPLFGGALTHEERGGRRYAVRAVAGSAATKSYRCPGCNQEIRPGTAHVVAWPVDGPDGGGDERRHWHSGCWRR